MSKILSRRHAFKLAGLAGAAVALRDRSAWAEPTDTAPTALTQGAGFYRTHVGELEITVVSDGFFPLADPFPLFGANASRAEVEQVLKDAFIDPTNIPGQVNILLVRKPGGPVTVIDTGCGRNFGPTAGFARQTLATLGVTPKDVASVLLTHLHPDHAGGVIGENGELTFPDASHNLHQEEFEFWVEKKPDFSKSGVPEGMQAGMTDGAHRVLKAMHAAKRQVVFGIEEIEIDLGIHMVHTGGHTPGHCCVRIESGGQSLLYVSDLIIQSAIVTAHPEWLVGYDTDGPGTVGVREKLFAELAEKRTLICGSHLPFPSLGHLKKAATGYEYVPAPWRWA